MYIHGSETRQFFMTVILREALILFLETRQRYLRNVI